MSSFSHIKVLQVEICVCSYIWEPKELGCLSLRQIGSNWPQIGPIWGQSVPIWVQLLTPLQRKVRQIIFTQWWHNKIVGGRPGHKTLTQISTVLLLKLRVSSPQDVQSQRSGNHRGHVGRLQPRLHPPATCHVWDAADAGATTSHPGVCQGALVQVRSH